MLRQLALVFSVATAFAAGYYLSPGDVATAPPRSAPDAEIEVAALPPGMPPNSSTYYRTPPLVVIREKETVITSLNREWETRTYQPEVFRPRPVARPKTQLVAFAAAPFPYTGLVPRTRRPFLNFEADGRRGRKTYSGRIYWADETYSDSRVLLHIPKGFDSRRPGVMVLFFHGHGATLERDVVNRQRVPMQISESGMNAVLVAPQFAVDARDSSAGNFWKPGGVRRFLDEVADKLADLHGGPLARQTFANMPLVIVGYSGGYVPTAWALASRAVQNRIKGVVLLDGLYGELGKFASWITRDRSAFFLSAYTQSTLRGNRELMRILSQRNIPYRQEVGSALSPGSVTFVEAELRHRDYVTRAWAENPISDLLVKLPRLPRRPESAPSLVSALSR